ncbi:MAG TPA: DUF4198 domain-containing protein, partial [Albitalea sp.]|jgi:hypothetical protein|nr:DUF4198 domain-containing protein [Albitalea sp.]
MALGTGNQFPLQEFPISAEQLRRSGCREGERALPLTPRGVTATALTVAAVAESRQALTCWTELLPFEIELAPDKIRLYLKEINAPASVREAWAALQARGLPWKERYTKHARIEFAGESASVARPVEMGMDVILDSGLGPIRSGDPLVFQVLRDGQPLAGLAVELRSDRVRVGLWMKTDAQGRVRVKAPLPGRWVLRGTDLRLSETDTWESRFVALAFEVGK